MITNISIQGFGPIKEVDFNIDDNITIITGKNGTGKTSIIAAILYAFYGSKAVQICSSDNGESFVKLKYIDDNGVCYCIERHYNSCQKHTVRLKIDYNSSRELSKLTNQKFEYRYPVLISDLQTHMDGKFDIDKILELLENNINSNLQNNFVYNLIKRIKGSSYNNAYRVCSGGEKFILVLFGTITRMLEDGLRLLIIDGLGMYVSPNIASEIIDILTSIKNLQIIITTNHNYFNKLNNYKTVIHLNHEESSENFISKIGCNYSFYPSYPIKNQYEIQGKNIIQYILKDVTKLEENIYTEFKEVKGDSPINSIISVADQYIVAYLNSKSNITGKILWGISDDRIIKGVKLTYSDKDKLRREISNKVSQITPYVQEENYSISFHNIYDNNYNAIDDLYIVEIIVESTYSEFLYSTGKDEVYVKSDGGKRKMKNYEIQQEAIKRKMIKNKV